MTATAHLFDDTYDGVPLIALAPGVALLPGFALEWADELQAAVEQVSELAPLRHMLTPNGLAMQAAMTNCGDLGWVSDQHLGYRYQATDPLSGHQWPAMPPLFRELARLAAKTAGLAEDFAPDACLINRYTPGARLGLHQDRDERDHIHPIVSVSLGLPATFLLGGLNRRAPVARVPLAHGDVVVLGGPARLRFHGVAAIAAADRWPARFNITLRRAG